MKEEFLLVLYTLVLNATKNKEATK